jgi:hypothetical protein
MKIKDIILKENDDDLFSDKPRTPPKNIGQLFTWAQVDPTNRKDFLIVAKFGIRNQLTLKKTLETLQYFDDADETDLEHFGINDDTATKLYNAYENIFYAWNNDTTGETSTTDSWEDLDEEDNMFADRRLITKIQNHLNQWDAEDDDEYYEATEDMANTLGFEEIEADADNEYDISATDQMFDLLELYQQNPDKAEQVLQAHLKKKNISPSVVLGQLTPRDDWRWHERVANNDLPNGLEEAEVAEPPERPRKTTTQTKTKPDVKFDPFQPKPDQPLANRPEEPKGADKPADPTMRRATAASTRRATGSIHASDQMRDMLSRMRDIEIDPDLAPYPVDEPTLDISTQVNTENLPAVAGEALQAAGVTSPEFHQVARLPGNMSQMIRQLGKVLFGSMTTTATEDIYMIGNLGGQGPNTRQEVNAVANWVRNHGDDLGPGDIDFDRVMPGYSAQTQQYVAAGVRWLLVKDFAGEYIYAWPESDSKTAGSQAQLGREPKRLGETDDMFGSEDQYGSKARLGKRVTNAFGRIYDSTPDADDALNYLDNHGELYNYLMNKHKYDIDIIIDREPETVLKDLALEVERIADELESGI